MNVNAKIRTLSASECDHVGGGFHGPVSGGPVSPEPPIPPIIFFGPVTTPQHGPIRSPYPSPIIGPFPIH